MLPRIPISNSILRCRESVLARGRTLFWFGRKLLAPTGRKSARNGERIKIVFVIDKITEWEGGTERQLHALIRTLDLNYFEPMLCFLFPTPELPPETLPCPAWWISKDREDIPDSLVLRIFRLARWLRRMRPQIVHTFFMEGVFAGILAARLSRVPRIVGSTRNAGYWKKFRHRLAFRSVARLAHRWQCNSRTLWEYSKKREGVSSERIEILPNAIDLRRFSPATQEERRAMRKKLGLSEPGPVFVAVAAFTPVKDLSILLEAAKLMEAQLPLAQYLLVGDGPLERELQQQAERLGLSRAVRFLGRQSDVRPYLAAADFGVLTSRSEGCSNSILEYMAMGLPSVVSDIAANRELVSGHLFPPGDAAGLAQGLLRLARDAAFCAELRREYSRTVSEFTLEKFAMRAQSFYSKLAAEINWRKIGEERGTTKQADSEMEAPIVS
jgi:glycosyltransferase involved in cell wall biosynthesis